MKITDNISNYIINKFEKNNFECMEENYKEIVFEYIGGDVDYDVEEEDFDTYSDYDDYLNAEDRTVRKHLKETKKEFKNKNIKIEFDYMRLNFDRGVAPVIEVGLK